MSEVMAQQERIAELEQQLRDYKYEWEMACERYRAMKQQAKECQAREAKLRKALEQFASVNLTEDNCASFSVANRRIKNIANMALALPHDDTALKEYVKQAQREALLEAADLCRIDDDPTGTVEGMLKNYLRRRAEELK